jgi:catabolite regulation protein CreA
MLLPKVSFPVQQILGLACVAMLACTPLEVASADNVNQRVVAEMSGSGFFLKDTLRIESFNDPKVDGVQLYISDFQKPMTEKIAKGDVFQDPTLAGLACSSRARVVVQPDATRSMEGEEIFSEARSLLFKSLKVRRIIDLPGQTVVYVLYSQKLNKNDDPFGSRFKSSLCAVHVDEFATAAPSGAEL